MPAPLKSFLRQKQRLSSPTEHVGIQSGMTGRNACPTQEFSRAEATPLFTHGVWWGSERHDRRECLTTEEFSPSSTKVSPHPLRTAGLVETSQTGMSAPANSRGRAVRTP